MKSKFLVVFLMVAVFLAGCGQSNDESADIKSTDDLKEVVNDYSVGKIEATPNHQASITAQELIISNGGDQTAYDLPEDEFFVSIAPFMHETHP